MSNLIGKMLGKYHIVEAIGRGGMAQVYKGYQAGIERYVAIKVLHHHLAQDPGFVSRFEREAMAMARLRHPNIVQLHDFDREADPDGGPSRHYIVMELVNGPTLKAELENRKVQEQLLQPEEAALLLSVVAQAVQYAHSRGMIHRDLKPANIMFGSNGQPLVTDFGLARLLDMGGDLSTGITAGTPAYMSPEQAQGERGDERSDIYSLGIVLYEMVTGELPFHDEAAFKVIFKHINEPMPLPSERRPDLPVALEQVILKATAKAVEERYQRASDFALALLEAVGAADGSLSGVALSGFAPLSGQEPYTPTTSISPVTPRLAGRVPYRGLFAFREEDAPFFFGREEFTNRLLKAVERSPLVSLLGPSGSGKSSVMFAGVLPQVRQWSGWLVASFRPNREPFHNLARAIVPFLQSADSGETQFLKEVHQLAEALAKGEVLFLHVVERILEKNGASHLLLVADQFEEVFTLATDNESRDRFLDLFVTTTEAQRNRGEVISTLALTMRADFLGQALTFPPFAELLAEDNFLLGPMSRRELSQAIINPAQLLGVSFESGLVERILQDVGDEPGNLPLLEFALTLLWEGRKGRRLPHEGYEAAGRVEGALSRYADQVYNDLTPEQQNRARAVFTQMVRPGEGTEDTRRISNRAELGEAGWQLIQQLADARLVVTGQDANRQETAEIVHEALIAHWGRLRQWMEQDRHFRVWQERLRASIRQWETSQRDEGALLRGAPLAEAAGWLDNPNYPLSPAEREYIEAGRARQQQELAAQEAQRQRELEAARKLAETERKRADEQGRANQRMKRLAFGLALVFLLAVILASLAVNQRNQAVRESEARATEEQRADEAADLAATRAVEAQSAAFGAATVAAEAELDRDAALAAEQAANVERQRANSEAALALSRQLSAQAQVELSGRQDAALLLSLAANEITGTFESLNTLVTALQARPGVEAYLQGNHLVFGSALLADGQTLALMASVPEATELLFVDIASREVIETWELPFSHGQLAISPDGRTVATGDFGGEFIIWQRENGRAAIIETFFTEDMVAQDMSFTPDGRWLVRWQFNGPTVELWDTTTWERAHVLIGHTGAISPPTFSSDGRLMATAAEDRQILIWDLTTGEQVEAIATEGIIGTLAFHPERPLVAASECLTLVVVECSQMEVRYWSLDDSETPPTLVTTFDEWISALQFTPDGQTLWVAQNNGHVSPFEVATGEPLDQPYTIHTQPVYGVYPLTDSRHLITQGIDGLVVLWDTAKPEPLSAFTAGQPAAVLAAALAPDGASLVTGSEDGSVQRWDTESGELVETLLGQTAVLTMPLQQPVYSPDGTLLAAGSQDGHLLLWADSGRLVTSPLEAHTGAIKAIAFSPDSSLIASGGEDGRLLLWQAASQTISRELTLNGVPIQAAGFTVDGRLLVAGDADGALAFWEMSSGELLTTTVSHELGVKAIAFSSADASLMVSVDGNGNVYRWNLEGELPSSELLFNTFSTQYPMALSPDGETVAIGANSLERWIELWPVDGGQQPAAQLPVFGRIQALSYAPDGRTLAVALDDGQIFLWDVTAEPPTARTLAAHSDAITGIAFSPDGAQLLSVGLDRVGRVWEVASGELLATLDNPLSSEETFTVQAVTAGPAGQIWAAGSRHSFVSVWDAVSGEVVIPATSGVMVTPRAMRFNQDGSLLAMGDDTGRVVLWDMVTQQVRHQWFFTNESFNEIIYALAFSPNGRWLAAGSFGDGEIQIWDVVSGESQDWHLEGFIGQIVALEFSPDGQGLAGGGASAWYWDLTTEPPTTHFSPFEGGSLVRAVAVSPDNRFVVIGDSFGQLGLWDISNSRPIGQLINAHLGRPRQLLFAADGSRLFSTGSDGRVIGWFFGGESWQQLACQIANRELSAAEWSVYLGDDESAIRLCTP
jgi:WD40 repeat protein/serine/threonine protein kinase